LKESLITHCWVCFVSEKVCSAVISKIITKVDETEATTMKLADNGSRASGDAALNPQQIFEIWLFC
jgi:hypothetical protein